MDLLEHCRRIEQTSNDVWREGLRELLRARIDRAKTRLQTQIKLNRLNMKH